MQFNIDKLPIPSEVGGSKPRNWKLAEQFPASGLLKVAPGRACKMADFVTHIYSTQSQS